MDDTKTIEEIIEHFDEYENRLKELLELNGVDVDEQK